MLRKPDAAKALESVYARAGLPCELEPTKLGGMIVYAASRDAAERIARLLADTARICDPHARVEGDARFDADEDAGTAWWVGVRWSWDCFEGKAA